MEYSLVELVLHWLKRERVQLPKEEVQLQLLSHPQYPSFLAITDTLEYFEVPHLAAKLPPQDLEKLPKNFVALTRHDDTLQISLVQKKKQFIRLSTTQDQKLSYKEFKAIWDGTILILDSDSVPASARKGGRSRKHLWLFFSVLVLVALTFQQAILPWAGFATLALAFVGIAVSYLVVANSLGTKLKVVSKVCESGTTEKQSCTAVTNSKYGQLFGAFNLGDLSLIYFSTISLLLILVGYDHLFFKVLAVINVVMVSYSLIAQFILIRKWCPLCLVIGGIALLHSVVSFVDLTPTSLFVNGAYWAKAAMLFVGCGMLWMYGKRLIQEATQKHQAELKHITFKRKAGLFQLLLEKQVPVKSPQKGELSIAFGNLNAPLVLTAITNPMCLHCSSTFMAYDKLLSVYGDQIRLNVVFSVPAPVEKSPATVIAQKTIQRYESNPAEAYQLLKNWFKDTRAALQNMADTVDEMSRHSPRDFKQLYHQHRWLQSNGITSTPQTLIGARPMPEEYEVQDLPNFIGTLSEQAITVEANRPV